MVSMKVVATRVACGRCLLICVGRLGSSRFLTWCDRPRCVDALRRPDATLGELAGLIKEVRPEIRKARNCRLSMALVYVARCPCWLRAGRHSCADCTDRGWWRYERLTVAFERRYPDKNGRPKMRSVGTVHAARAGADDAKTLSQLKFQIGDFLDVAINV